MKIAVITGASGGIGAATAKRFLTAGYAVVNLSRRSAGIVDVFDLQGDLAKNCRTEAFASTLREHVQNADEIALIHNACLHYNDRVDTTSDTQLEAVLALNISVPNTLNRLLIPYMQPGSSILYVGSTLAEKAVASAFSYVLSKHALVGMMRATTQDLADTGIHAVCVCPGFTDTEMLRHHIGDDPEVLAAVEKRSAADRLIQPAEIAEVLFTAATMPVLNGSVIQAGLGQKET